MERVPGSSLCSSQTRQAGYSRHTRCAHARDVGHRAVCCNSPCQGAWLNGHSVQHFGVAGRTMAVFPSMLLVCGVSEVRDVRGRFNRRACRRLHLPAGVADIFRWASAQHAQAAEYGGEKEATRRCGGMPWFMVFHGNCSGVTTALQTMCSMARMGRTDAPRLGGVDESDDSSGSRTCNALSFDCFDCFDCRHGDRM